MALAVLQNETVMGLHPLCLGTIIEPSFSEDEQLMHRFEYRNPRFAVDLPAQFCVLDELLAGRCTDIGIKGMRLDLPHNVVSGCKGTVVLHYQNQTIDLKVVVARVGAMYCGLEFVCDSHTAQSSVAHLVAKLTAPHCRHLMSLVPRAHTSLGGPTSSIS